jgi:hypothetical protein
MQKILVTFIVLAVAAPVRAEVLITCEQLDNTNEVVVSYDARSQISRVRAFALDVRVSDGNIVDVNCVSDDYTVHPGSIHIDENGNVVDHGSCVCAAGYSGTLGGLDTNGVTIETGSLYVGEANAPDACGVLLTFIVDGIGAIEVTINENTIRHGVVLEDYDTPAEVNAPGCSILNDPNIGTCWDPNECAGQPYGDSSCDGTVGFLDLGKTKMHFFSHEGEPNYDCCTDYNHDGKIDFLDLGILKRYHFTTGYTPSTGNQSCPP